MDKKQFEFRETKSWAQVSENPLVALLTAGQAAPGAQRIAGELLAQQKQLSAVVIPSVLRVIPSVTERSLLSKFFAADYGFGEASLTRVELFRDWFANLGIEPTEISSSPALSPTLGMALVTLGLARTQLSDAVINAVELCRTDSARRLFADFQTARDSFTQVLPIIEKINGSRHCEFLDVLKQSAQTSPSRWFFNS